MNIKNNKDLDDVNRDKNGYIPVHRYNSLPPKDDNGRVRISARNKEKQQNHLADTNKDDKKVVIEVDEVDDFVTASITKSSEEQEPTKSENKDKKKNKKKKGKKKNKSTKGVKKSPELLREMPFHPDKKINKIIKELLHNLKIKKISNDSDVVDIFMQPYKNYIRFNVDEGQFYWYTGKYWKVDDEYQVYKCIEKVCYEINCTLKENNADKSALKQIILYGNNRFIKNLLEMTKTRCVCHSEDFDKHTYLLNVRNGTVNLKTKELQEHNPEDMITQFIDIDYNSDATGGRFGDFIPEICACDKELVKYLQVMYGYALTGETREQCFFIERGSGSNGKSTLNEVISEVVTQYTERVNSSLFQKSGNTSANAPTPEVAKLVKIRILFCSETDDNRLREALIKEYTGGTKITARELYGKPFIYMPQFTIIFDGNILPTINGVDHGIWRRIVVVPFNRKFDKDITLKDTLLQEKEVILKWLIDGAYKYYKKGLPECKAVKEATKKYREEENIVESFLEHAVITYSDSKYPASALYSAYSQYCTNCCSTPVNNKLFKAALTMKGYKSKRTNKGMVWMEICPKDDICE